MKDSMQCQHTDADGSVYKEVVVIGNGPSGMVTSFMLAGNVPYLKPIPEDLPIDEMLRARLSNLPEGQSLYETDLMELAEGLEGRSQNPIPLLMDNLIRPCADLGVQADSLIEWRYDAEKQIEHIVLGRGPPGGAWHTFPPGVRTLSPGAWLALPPHAPRGAARLTARAVAIYCRRYVQACRLQRYFRSGVVVTAVGRQQTRCEAPGCDRPAGYYVTGYDKSSGERFRYTCARVVLASGAERANTLAPHVSARALHSLHAAQRAASLLALHAASPPPRPPPEVLVVGSGVSGADGVWLALRAGLRVRHLHRRPAPALAALDPAAYPDYSLVYKMMSDGASGQHHNYTSYPSHVILDVTPEPSTLDLNTEDIEEYNLSLKRVKLLNTDTNETTDILVNLICVFIGSRPDLNFLQTNFNLNCIDVVEKPCQKCLEEKAKRNMEEKCFLKNHWHYFKTVLGQSIQSCKSRYLNLNEKCICDGNKCDMKDIPYSEVKVECECEMDPYANGIGFGVDPDKPVDSRNPIAVDKSTHEVLNAPKGMYALGPLTADTFMRFIPGGALALVSHMHKEK